MVKKNKRKKAQAAMEFLMSYGWAILVVLVVIGAVSYFGVQSSERFLPRSCTLEPGIGCDDFALQEDSITFVLRNGIGSDLNISNLTVEGCSSMALGTLDDGEQGRFLVSGCTNSVDSRNAKNIYLHYNKRGGVTHLMQGRVVGDVESGSSSASGVCQNADDNSLCTGLDLVYGSGYQADCCSNYGVCC